VKQYESYSNNLRTKNQKTNYITIHIARKLDTLYENNVKNYFIQENALSLLIRINQINILIENFKLDYTNNVLSLLQQNIITFFIIRDFENDKIDMDSSIKLVVLIVFNEKYYGNKLSNSLKEDENKEIDYSLEQDNNEENNNEFIQGLTVKKIK